MILEMFRVLIAWYSQVEPVDLEQRKWNVKPPVTPLSEIVKIGNNKVLVIEIREGVTNHTAPAKTLFYQSRIRQGANFPGRTVTAFSGIRKNICRWKHYTWFVFKWYDDKELFYSFYEKQLWWKHRRRGISLDIILENLNLAKEGRLNLAGLLLFGRIQRNICPIFSIKAVSFFGKSMVEPYIW